MVGSFSVSGGRLRRRMDLPRRRRRWRRVLRERHLPV